MGEDQLEFESRETSIRWREGFSPHKAIRGLVERHADSFGPLRTPDVKDVAWDLGVSQATLYCHKIRLLPPTRFCKAI